MRFIDWHPSERLLSLFAGNDLGAWSRLLVGRHVAGCDDCAQSVAGYESLRAELARAQPVPETDFGALARQIRAAAAMEPLPSPTGRWRWHLAEAGLAAAIAIAVLLPLETDGPSVPAIVSTLPDEAAWSVPEAFVGTEAQLTAEGGLTVRAFHAGSGTLTITEYYAP